MIKCIFFDRDGVLIKNYGYLNDISKLKWLNGAINSIKILNKKKIRAVVVTNQSGIARGFFTEQELKKFHTGMNYILKKKKAIIDTFFYCPFHPNGNIKKYKKKSNLRKPGNGMLLKAMKKFKLRPSECAMIGDQKSDYLSAKKTKIYFEYKKNYALDIQINNVLKKFNDK
tara:strand:- start:109 stop:621 length:513 start_codon:yes stop_codon:yes gene_type:complete